MKGANMANASQVQDWYTNRLKEYYSQYYRASVAFDEGESDDDAEALYPKNTELGSALVAVEPAKLPDGARAAYAYYKKHVMDEDWGTVRAYRISVAETVTFAIRVTTDGDDGWLEVYDENGALVGAGRTYIELVAWHTPEQIRGLIAGRNLPPGLDPKATLWGKPLTS
jgi:hypothetical protein